MLISSAISGQVSRAFLLALVLLLGSYAGAEVFVLNEANLDTGDANPGDGVAMTAEGLTTLRAAIEEANALPGKDRIIARSLESNCAAAFVHHTLYVEDDLELVVEVLCLYRFGSQYSQINGPYYEPGAPLFAVSEGVTFQVENLELRGSDVDGGGVVVLQPGAVFVGKGVHFGAKGGVNGGIFYNDHGSIYLSSGIAFDRFIDEHIVLNTQMYGESSGDGGAIYNDGGLVEIEDNASVGGFVGGTGGAIYNREGTVRIRGALDEFDDPAILYGDAAGGHGGSIYNDGGILDLSGCTMRFSSALESGGGIYQRGGTTILRQVHFRSCNDTVDGAGIYLESGTLLADGVMFSLGSASGDGAGAYIAGGEADFLNSTFSGNTAGGSGGGLYAAPGAAVRLVNTTFTLNEAQAGGGFFAAAGKGAPGLEIGNSIIAQNGAALAPDAAGVFTSLGHNLAGIGDTGGQFDGAGDQTGTAEAPLLAGLAPRDPREEDHPATPGEAAPVHALLEDSPAIDAGDTALAMTVAERYPELPGGYDQSGPGYPRYQGTAIDIGAYEVQVAEELPEFHTADQNRDNAFNLSEVLRVIQFFNSGSHHCQPGTEDGYAPGPGGNTCTPHTADYNPADGRITLTELLRLVQLYNSDGYAACPDVSPPTEDGYCLVAS